MTKEQEFRKQTEEAKFEAFSFMCKKVAELEGKLQRAENLNFQDAKLIKEYGDRIADLEAQVNYWKSEYDKLFNEV